MRGGPGTGQGGTRRAGGRSSGLRKRGGQRDYMNHGMERRSSAGGRMGCLFDRGSLTTANNQTEHKVTNSE